MTLGQRIKRFRLLNDIRQEDMAEKMGVSRATLINYEKGHTTINFDVLEKSIKTVSLTELLSIFPKILDGKLSNKILVDVNK